MTAISAALEISRSNLYDQACPSPRKKRYSIQEDENLLPLIREIIETRQTYGFRRVTAVLNHLLQAAGKRCVNHKRVYRIMHQHGLLLTRVHGDRTGVKHDGSVETAMRNTRWCADGFEVSCDNGEHVASSLVWTPVIGKSWLSRPQLEAIQRKWPSLSCFPASNIVLTLTIRLTR